MFIGKTCYILFQDHNNTYITGLVKTSVKHCLALFIEKTGIGCNDEHLYDLPCRMSCVRKGLVDVIFTVCENLSDEGLVLQYANRNGDLVSQVGKYCPVTGIGK